MSDEDRSIPSEVVQPRCPLCSRSDAVENVTITPMRPGEPYQRPYCWACRKFFDIEPDADDSRGAQ